MKKPIHLQAYKALSFLEKTKGLLDKKRSIIYFETRFGIHTFGMKSTVVVVILNNANEITEVKKVNPNCIFFWNPKYYKIIEMYSDIASKYTLIKGTKILL